MMDLLQGHQYSLSNENKNNKSLIFVKLTDSALKSIETYLSSNVDSSSKPTIQFQNNSGKISLPLNGVTHSYGFTLSEIEGDKVQSCFQCVQHVDNGSLDSLGFMSMKMQIQATDDSYEQTKSKLAAVDQEQKNLCTKELQTVARLGNKVSVKRPGLMYIPEKARPNAVKPESTKFNLKNKAISPSSLIQQPIRQRIIHILAAKAYKKAELVLRLKKEGISEKHKEQINDILIQVAKVKGNILALEDHIWDEVQEDWEFSSKEELQLIKKKKQQFLKPKNVNGVTGLSKPTVKQKGKPSILEQTLSSKKLLQHMNGQNSKSVEKPNLPNNRSSQTSKRQYPATNNIGSLLSSFVQQQHRPEEINGKKEEKVSVELSNGNHIDQCAVRPSNPMTPSSIPLHKQAEHSKVSKIQVKQSTSCAGNSISRNGFTVQKTALEKVNLVKQMLKDNTLKSRSSTIKKGNTVNNFHFSKKILNFLQKFCSLKKKWSLPPAS